MRGLDFLLGLLPFDLRQIHATDLFTNGSAIRLLIKIRLPYSGANQFGDGCFPLPSQGSKPPEFVRVHQKLAASRSRHLWLLVRMLMCMISLPDPQALVKRRFACVACVSCVTGAKASQRELYPLLALMSYWLLSRFS